MILKNIIYNLIYLLDYYTINYDNTEFIHILFVFLQSHIGCPGPAGHGGRGGRCGARGTWSW